MKQTQDTETNLQQVRPDVPLWAQQLQWRLDQVQLSLYRIEERLASNPSLHERKDQPSADREDTSPKSNPLAGETPAPSIPP